MNKFKSLLMYVWLYRRKEAFLRWANLGVKTLSVIFGNRLGKMLVLSRAGSDPYPDVVRVIAHHEAHYHLERNGPYEYLKDDGSELVSIDRIINHVKQIPLYILDHAKFHPDTGMVATSDYHIIVDTPLFRKKVRSSPVYGIQLPTCKQFTGTYASVADLWSYNYSHLLLMILPMLYDLKMFNEAITLLVPTNTLPLHQLAIKICLPENVTLQMVEPNEWLGVERFIYTPRYMSQPSIYISRPHLDYIRTCIFEYLELQKNHTPGSNIIISRRNSISRRVQNERELETCLAEYGFQSYCLEDLTFEAQVKLFHDARIVVAPHGAGEANILFGGNTSLIELGPQYPVLLFEILAKVLGQNYYRVMPLELNNQWPAKSKNIRVGTRLPDIPSMTIDVGHVENLVKSLL